MAKTDHFRIQKPKVYEEPPRGPYRTVSADIIAPPTPRTEMPSEDHFSYHDRLPPSPEEIRKRERQHRKDQIITWAICVAIAIGAVVFAVFGWIGDGTIYGWYGVFIAMATYIEGLFAVGAFLALCAALEGIFK